MGEGWDRDGMGMVVGYGWGGGDVDATTTDLAG